MNNKQQRQADRMAVFDKLFNPETKIIATPNAENIGLARYMYAAEGILRDAYEQVKRNVTFLQNGLVTPNDHFEGALAAFDKKASKSKIQREPDVNPVLALAEKELPSPHGSRPSIRLGSMLCNVTEGMQPEKGDYVMIGSRLCVIKKVKK
jgi:hypothetical protein